MGNLNVGSYPKDNSSDCLKAKSRVLEETQQQQIDRDRNDEAELPVPVIAPSQKTESGKITDQSGKRHEETESCVPIPVEHVPRHGQPDVTRPGGSEQPESDVGDREKDEEEYWAVEEHSVVPISSCN